MDNKLSYQNNCRLVLIIILRFVCGYRLLDFPNPLAQALKAIISLSACEVELYVTGAANCLIIFKGDCCGKKQQLFAMKHWQIMHNT